MKILSYQTTFCDRTINGHPVKNYDELYHLLSKVDIGSTINLQLRRGASTRTVACQTIDIGAY
jgi:S1-C subfamily serine protease